MCVSFKHIAAQWKGKYNKANFFNVRKRVRFQTVDNYVLY